METVRLSMLKDSLPYGKSIDITKIECVAHIQKRM